MWNNICQGSKYTHHDMGTSARVAVIKVNRNNIKEGMRWFLFYLMEQETSLKEAR